MVTLVEAGSTDVRAKLSGLLPTLVGKQHRKNQDSGALQS